MSDFLAAVGLLFVIEGLLYGGFPYLAKKLAREASEAPESALRVAESRRLPSAWALSGLSGDKRRSIRYFLPVIYAEP